MDENDEFGKSRDRWQTSVQSKVFFCGYFLWGEVYSGDYVNMNISITKCSNSMELVSFISNMDGIVNTNSGAFEIFE